MEKLSYLYLHFPFCRHLCNYCDFYKRVPKDNVEVRAFEAQLLQQADELTKVLTQKQKRLGPLKTLYFGGGTPSLWGEEGAKFFATFLSQYQIELEKSYEWTMEVNPGSWTKESLDAWTALGVNRFSLGVQSLDGQFLKLLDRVHNVDDAYDTLKEFQKREINFSVDFMLGLPQSELYQRDIIQELEDILKFSPDHLSLYILTTKDHYVHQKLLPTEEWIEEEYLKVSQYLRERGFVHYEVSNFAKPGKESAHNLAYWRSESVVALGPSATGLFADEGLRYKWAALQANPVWEQLSPEDLVLEKIYMKLRTNLGLSLDELFDPKHHESLLKLFKSWEKKGWASRDSRDLVILTSQGYLILDSLMDQLFPYF